MIFMAHPHYMDYATYPSNTYYIYNPYQTPFLAYSDCMDNKYYVD